MHSKSNIYWRFIGIWNTQRLSVCPIMNCVHMGYMGNYASYWDTDGFCMFKFLWCSVSVHSEGYLSVWWPIWRQDAPCAWLQIAPSLDLKILVMVELKRFLTVSVIWRDSHQWLLIERATKTSSQNTEDTKHEYTQIITKNCKTQGDRNSIEISLQNNWLFNI